MEISSRSKPEFDMIDHIRTWLLIGGRLTRYNLIALELATLSASGKQFSKHDDHQHGAEGEVERVELDWNGHGCRVRRGARRIT
jgi:hypothetical protein